MKKIFTLILAVCAFSVVLAGCGAKEDAATPPADTSKPADPATKE